MGTGEGEDSWLEFVKCAPTPDDADIYCQPVPNPDDIVSLFNDEETVYVRADQALDGYEPYPFADVPAATLFYWTHQAHTVLGDAVNHLGAGIPLRLLKAIDDDGEEFALVLPIGDIPHRLYLESQMLVLIPVSDEQNHDDAVPDDAVSSTS